MEGITADIRYAIGPILTIVPPTSQIQVATSKIAFSIPISSRPTGIKLGASAVSSIQCTFIMATKYNKEAHVHVHVHVHVLGETDKEEEEEEEAEYSTLSSEEEEEEEVDVHVHVHVHGERDEEEQEQEAESSSSQPLISDEMERELADWLRANPFLWDRSHPEYGMTSKKATEWYDKAEEIRVRPVELRTWFEGIKSQVINRTRVDYGPARIQFLEDNFLFLSLT